MVKFVPAQSIQPSVMDMFTAFNERNDFEVMLLKKIRKCDFRAVEKIMFVRCRRIRSWHSAPCIRAALPGAGCGRHELEPGFSDPRYLQSLYCGGRNVSFNSK